MGTSSRSTGDPAVVGLLAAVARAGVLCCLVAIASAQQGHEAGDDPPAEVALDPGAVILLELLDWDGSHYSCASAFVLKSGWIVTTWHGIEGAASIKVNAGQDGLHDVTELVAESETSDVVVMKLPAGCGLSGGLEWRPTATETGDGVTIAVRQSSGAFVTARGKVQGTAPDAVSEHILLQSTARAWPGCSGSPGLDNSGHVVGMLVSVSPDGPDGSASEATSNFLMAEDIVALPVREMPLNEWLKSRFNRAWTTAARLARGAAMGAAGSSTAEAQLRRANEINPDSRWILLRYCHALESSGKWEELGRVAGEFAARHPSAPFPYLVAGGALARLKRPNESIAALRAACATPDAGGNTWYWLGVACWRGGDEAGMLEAFEKSLSLRPRNLLLLQALVRTYGKNSRNHDGIRVAEAWARNFPHDENALCALASLYKTIGDAERMAEAIERLRVLNPYLANRAVLQR